MIYEATGEAMALSVSGFVSPREGGVLVEAPGVDFSGVDLLGVDRPKITRPKSLFESFVRIFVRPKSLASDVKF